MPGDRASFWMFFADSLTLFRRSENWLVNLWGLRLHFMPDGLPIRSVLSRSIEQKMASEAFGRWCPSCTGSETEPTNDNVKQTVRISAS